MNSLLLVLLSVCFFTLYTYIIIEMRLDDHVQVLDHDKYIENMQAIRKEVF